MTKININDFKFVALNQTIIQIFYNSKFIVFEIKFTEKFKIEHNRNENKNEN